MRENYYFVSPATVPVCVVRRFFYSLIASAAVSYHGRLQSPILAPYTSVGHTSKLKNWKKVISTIFTVFSRRRSPPDWTCELRRRWSHYSASVAEGDKWKVTGDRPRPLRRTPANAALRRVRRDCEKTDQFARSIFVRPSFPPVTRVFPPSSRPVRRLAL